MRISFPFLVLVSACAAAANFAPAAEATAGKESSIADAKRELEAIKAMRGTLAQPPAALPQLTMPEFPVGTGTGIAPGARPTRKQLLESEQKSKNWLQDGIELQKKIDAQQSGKSRKEWTETETERLLTAREELRPADSAAAAADKLGLSRAEADANRKNAEAEREPRTGAAVANPLAGFMAGWMTSQDYALLQPAATASGAGNEGVSLGGGGGSVALPGSSVNASLGGADAAASIFNAGRAPTATVPRENPYLSSAASTPQLDVTFSLPAPVPAMPPPNLTTAPVFAPRPPVESAPARPKVPDFGRPPADEKYFKQLKRF